MKKIKFVFWLMGFGCGIALTGIAGTFLTLNIKNDNSISVSERYEEKPEADKTMEKARQDQMAESGSQAEDTNIKMIRKQETAEPDVTVKTATQTEETQETEENDKKNDIEKPETDKAAEDKKDTDVNETIKYKEIQIRASESAEEICERLEKAGLVEDGSDFLAYIKEHKKQRFLKHGRLRLPEKASYKTLLEALSVS